MVINWKYYIQKHTGNLLKIDILEIYFWFVEVLILTLSVISKKKEFTENKDWVKMMSSIFPEPKS